jgi:hypothetical protein
MSYLEDTNGDPVQRVANIAMSEQGTHDNLNANANLQVGDVDVSAANPVPVSGTVGIDQTTANANEVVTKAGSVTTATLNAETTKVIGTVNNKVADGDDVALGAKADAAATIADTTPFSVIALLKGIWNKLAGILTVSISGSNTRKWATDTITIGTGAVHSAGYVVSTDAGEILVFDTGLTAGTSGIILDSLVTLAQDAVFANGAGYTLHLFDESPTVQATNTAFDLADADLPMYVGKITISTLVDMGSNCAITDTGHNLSFTLASADTNLYGKLVCNDAETTIDAKVITINLGIAAL